MIHREGERLPKPLREFSARLLEDQLVRLSRANAVIERLIGPALRRMSGERLYRRLGFDVREQLRPVAGAPMMWTMWRDPRSVVESLARPE